MSDYPHGHYRRYQTDRCRCIPCRAANNTYNRDRRRAITRGTWTGLVDATATIRRVRALAATGWTYSRIAEWLQVNQSIVSELARGTQVNVFGRTAVRIAEIYDRWSTEDGPSSRTARHAARKGWAGPEAWDDDTIDDPTAAPFSHVVQDVDDIAVERAVAGDQRIAAQLNDVELLHAVEALTARKASARDIGQLLGVTGRTVVRTRSVLRELVNAA